MKRLLSITRVPIDEAQLIRERSISGAIGAVVYFVGTVRAEEGGALISAIEYEAFLAMAERQFQMLFDQVEARWPVESIRLVHRLGVVPVSEPSLWVELSTPHRAEAFAACQYLIDEMKKLVPIWKKPLTTGGAR